MDEDLDILYDETATDYDEIDEDEAIEAIEERILENVPSDIDKREGSLIYNALAPIAIELSLLYQELKLVLDEGFADTASLDYLIRRASERGISYKEATRAVVKGRFLPSSIDVLGCRFYLVDTELAYVVTKKIEDGLYELECETAGLDGNVPSGQLILDETNGNDDAANLETSEIIGILEQAVEEEDVEAFRQRYFDSIDSQAFGGNIADYKSKVLAQPGIGGVKVYPVWNGGGTVKLVILNQSFSVPDERVVEELQTLIDPEQNQGEGKGLAPIGHVVTVVAAEAVLMNLEIEVAYTGGATQETSEETMKAAVEEYLLTVRQEWGEADFETGSVVRKSYIENKLLSLPQILDVQVLTVNGNERNIELEPRQVPVMGEFTYVEGITTT